MTTYRQKLLDPRWQKRRLECLESADWSCESCGTEERTLHVHHPQYFAGREPWDYRMEELQVLCDECHGDATRASKALKGVVSSIHPQYRETAGLVGAFLGIEEIESEGCGQARMVGLVARALMNGSYEQLRAVASSLGVLNAEPHHSG